MNDPALNQRLAEVARVAVELEKKTGCPARAMVAQWALESHWGAKPAGHANYFGIKKAARHTLACTVMTREVIDGKSVMQPLAFADYASLADSCADYAWLMTHGAPYRAAWTQYQRDFDVGAFVGRVAAVYATDPHYRELAVAIANQPNVRGAVQAVRQEYA